VFWNFVNNNTVVDYPLGTTKFPPGVPFTDKYNEHIDCTEASRIDDYSTNFTLSVRSCEGIDTRFTLNPLSDVGCSVSTFRWSYDDVGPQAVNRVIRTALDASESCAFEDELGALGKIPRELKLVSQTILPPIPPPSWLSSEETKHDGPPAPKQANGNPQITNSTPKQTNVPVSAVIPFGPGTTSATVIYNKDSGLNTLIQGSTTSIFAGSEVTAAGHRIQISEGREVEGEAGQVVLRVNGSDVLAPFTPIPTSISGGGGTLLQPYDGRKGPVVQTSSASSAQLLPLLS
jgi:hypothetical protein